MQRTRYALLAALVACSAPTDPSAKPVANNFGVFRHAGGDYDPIISDSLHRSIVVGMYLGTHDRCGEGSIELFGLESSSYRFTNKEQTSYVFTGRSRNDAPITLFAPGDVCDSASSPQLAAGEAKYIVTQEFILGVPQPPTIDLRGVFFPGQVQTKRGLEVTIHVSDNDTTVTYKDHN